MTRATAPHAVARECAETLGSLLRVHHAFRHLADEVDAPSVLISLTNGFSIEQGSDVRARVHSGFTRAALTATGALHGVDCRDDPFIKMLMERSQQAFADDDSPSPVYSARRAQLIPDIEWFRHPFYTRYFRPMNFGYAIASVCRAGRDDTRGYIVAFMIRPPQRGPFSDEQVSLTHELMSSLGPMVTSSTPPLSEMASQAVAYIGDIESQLSEAERRIFPFLLTPLSEGEIAVRVSRSSHTVHSHVKQIFLAFEVKSRFELVHKYMMARCDT